MRFRMPDSSVIYLPPFPTPAKPKKGEACNGCGWCCHTEICLLGERFFPDTPAPCPAIVYLDGRVRCGFVVGEIALIEKDPTKEPIVQRMLGTGEGCCADDPNEYSADAG